MKTTCAAIALGIPALLAQSTSSLTSASTLDPPPLIEFHTGKSSEKSFKALRNTTQKVHGSIGLDQHESSRLYTEKHTGRFHDKHEEIWRMEIKEVNELMLVKNQERINEIGWGHSRRTDEREREGVKTHRKQQKTKRNKKMVSSHKRRMMSALGSFKPNTATGECNSAIYRKKCKSFKSFLEEEVNAEKEMVVIPCGICVKVDISDGSTIELPHGLNVIGKLKFVARSNVVIRTTAVIVQGIFHVPPAKFRRVTAPIPFSRSESRIVLYGDKELSFIPDGVNREVCGMSVDTGVPMPCEIGIKPFFVAGGRMNVLAMEESCPTYARLVDVVTSPDYGVFLSNPMAAECWGKGGRIVFASDTMYASDFQIATIKNVKKDSGLITLNAPLEYTPTTARQNPLYAVEVHLDNRNFVIEAEPTGTIGGHFVVHQTPGVNQVINGVEFRRMGQQGVEGRYPIHFHMSEDCLGSKISRNLIKDSFQRCVVIHGTHNVTIEHNVAFNTFGHCFMTEDGGEYDNKFLYNLGHYTRKMPENKRLSKDSSDHNAATFWWTNPKNTFIGNVAAGSEAHGIWFELHASVRAPSKQLEINRRANPRVQTLGTCKDNVAHSNKKHGLTTYKTGMLPKKQGVFQNLTSFRNGQSGMFIHNSENLKVFGGHFADNVEGVRILNADNIVVDGTTFVALSQSHYDSVQQRDTKFSSACKQNTVGLAGVTWSPTQIPFTGPTIVNAKFEEYENSVCKSIAIDAERVLLRDRIQYSAVKLSNLTFSSISNSISACRAIENMVTNIAVEDFDGSISGTKRPGFIVQKNQTMTNFLTAPCDEMSADSCLEHCPGSCLRNFVVSIPGTPNLEEVIMKIRDGNGNVASIPRRYTGDGMTVNKVGMYAVHLPFGEFTISFEDKNGKPTWPVYVSPAFEREPQCEHKLKVDDIKLVMPSADREACDELIYNGNFESGDVEGWQKDFCDIAVLDGGARRSKFGLRTIKRKTLALVRHVLDQSCMVTSGFQDYTIKGSFRLVDGNKDVTCDESVGGISDKACPTVSLNAGKIERRAFKIETKFTDGSWTHFSYTITLPPQAEKNEQVYLEFRGGRPGEYYLDNFSMRKTFYDGNHFVPFSAQGVYIMEMGRHKEDLDKNRKSFENRLRESPHGIVKRSCMGCQKSHMTIFYRRWSSHEGASLLDYFEESFKEVNNRFNVDFSLYSTYEDAVADRKRWKFCSFDDNKGFPGGCGPSQENIGQFNRYSSGGGASNVVFSVEVAGDVRR